MESRTGKNVMVAIYTAMDIPGETTKKQHEWFYKIYHWMDGERKILEIGCAWGRSSWAWLDCIESENSYLEILDNWAYSNSNGIKKIEKYNLDYYNKIKNIFPKLNQKEIVNYNLMQHKNYSKIKQINTDNSISFVKKRDVLNEFDIVYLDGDHSEFNVWQELNYFNGVKVICGDDFALAQPGVIKSVCRFYAKNYNTYKLYTDPDARFFALKHVDL